MEKSKKAKGAERIETAEIKSGHALDSLQERLEPSKAGAEQSGRSFLTRREFITGSAAFVTLLSTGLLPTDAETKEQLFEARYYERLENEEIQCKLCPKECKIGDRERGYCGARENRKGTYYSLVYGQPCAIHLDPIEKKPFFHVMPGTMALSFSTVGCNVECKFCQNWEISQSRPEQVYTRFTPPDAIVDKALAVKADSIAYTYGEPVIFIEYMQDTAKIARSKGVKSVVVTNGYINKKPLDDLCNLVDAIKIDLKAFDDKYYVDIVSGNLKPVLDSITHIFKRGIWLEIVYLMVPTLNDDMSKIRDMAKWILDNTADYVPVHFSRFFPQYRLKNLPPTPVSSLETAANILKEEGMKFVYIGNVPGNKFENTYCPSCSKEIISREGYRVKEMHVRYGRCEYCGAKIPGLWLGG